MARTRAPAAAPETIGPYRVQEQLGQGGMGRIYRAVDGDGRVVALKVIRPEHASDPTFRRRFAREARAALAVEHPHVVPVLASGEHDGMPYLATAYVDGGSLDVRLAEGGPLDLEAAVRLCLHVAGGLAALHRAGLVHRDVKPANILVDASGSAFVTDFGLAKSRDASALTRPGFAVGSLHYMAPEQARAEEVGPPTDVYGLGCVVYECLAGRPPFYRPPRHGRAGGAPARRAGRSVRGARRRLARAPLGRTQRAREGAGFAAAQHDGVRPDDAGRRRRAAAQPGPVTSPVRSSSTVAPTRSRSPTRTWRSDATGSSLTHVPFVESRSCTSTPSPSRVITA